MDSDIYLSTPSNIQYSDIASQDLCLNQEQSYNNEIDYVSHNGIINPD